MELYGDIYKVFDESRTIGQFCDNMDRFVEEALLDKRRKIIVEEFYSYFL